MRQRLLWVLLFAASAAACGDDAGDDSAAADGGGDGAIDGAIDGGAPVTAPVFGGIQLAYSPAPGEVLLEWIEAVDDGTAAADMQYLVFTGAVDTLAEDIVAGQAPAATLTGETAYRFVGLTPDVPTYFVVLAEDGDGERNTNLRTVEAQPIAEALVPKADLLDLEELDITATENGLNDFTLSGTGATDITAGDILLLNNSFGRSLRRVLTANAAGDSNDITTEKASLSDVVSSGVIRSYAGVSDSPELATRRRIVLTEPTTRQPTRELWESSDGHIRTESLDYGEPVLPDGVLADVVTLESGVTLEYTVSFEAGIAAEARWNESVIDTPSYIKSVALGKLAVDAVAAYNIDGAVNYEAKKELFSKTFTFTYAIGPVPVVQDVQIQFFGELEFNAEASVVMELVGHAEKSLTFGFEWDEASGYKLIEDEGFENVVTFNLEGEAGAKGVLKIYPVLTTRLYKAAGVSIYVVPQLLLEAAARLLPLPAEVMQFDLDFLVKAFVTADLTILGREIAKWQSDKLELVRIPIHSQPEIGLIRSNSQLDTCGTRKLYLRLTQGYSNEVPPENISWEVDGPGGSTLTVAEGGNSAEFSSDMAGDYTIDVSAYGDGFLGPIGTRYASTEINVVDHLPGDCDPANSEGGGAGDLIGCTPIQIGLTGVPYPEQATVSAGQNVTYHIPLYCGWSCWVTAEMIAMDIPGVRNYIDLIGGETLHGVALSDGVLPYEETLSVSGPTYLLKPGVYYPSMSLVNGPTSWGYYYSTTYFPKVDARDSYYMYQNDWHTYPTGSAVECDGDSGIPVHTIRVVGPDDPNDDDDEPDDARELEIDGKKVHSKLRDNADEDWYTYRPKAEPYYGAVYDSDDPYEPDCWVTAVAVNRYMKLFASKEAAEAGTPALAAASGRVHHPAVPDQKFYLQLSGTSGINDPYIIELVADCNDPEAELPHLTGAPTLSATTITRAEVVTVTVPYTPNVGRVTVSLTPVGGGPLYTSETNAAAAGTTSWTVDLAGSGIPSGLTGDYLIRVRLFRDVGSNYTNYERKPDFSPDNYTAVAEDYSLPLSHTSATDFPLAIVTINAI